MANGYVSAPDNLSVVPVGTDSTAETYRDDCPSNVPAVEPSAVHGTRTEPARPACGCGRGPHALLGVDADGNPGICELGHPLPGNQRTRKTVLAPVLEDKPIDLDKFSALNLTKQAAMLLVEQMEEQKVVIRSTRTVGARRKERKVMAEISAELRAHMTQVDRLQPFKREASASNILQRLSDDTLARVLSDLGASRLEDIADYDGPMPLRIEVTHRPVPDEPIASPVPAVPSEPVLERVPIPIEALGEDVSPRLVKGFSTPEAVVPRVKVTYQDSDGAHEYPLNRGPAI